MSTLALKPKISQEQIDQFHREGFLMVEDVFTDADLQPVIDEVSAEIDVRARELVASGELSRTYEEDDFERRLARISTETDKVALSIWNGQLAGPHRCDHAAIDQ